MINKTDEKDSEKGYAYSPGLKVKEATRVLKTRRLPIPGDVFVKIGDKIKYDTIVARTYISGDPEFVKASILLGIEPDYLPDSMIKNIGDKVAKDEVIARYSGLFGLIKKKVVSPIEGTIELISNATGQIVIRGMATKVDVDAYIPGKVVKILPTEGAIIETNAAFIQGIFGIGGETHGRIKVAVDSPDEKLTAEHITPEDKGVLIVGGSIMTLEAMRKGIDVGVSGIVTGGVRHKDIKTFLGTEIGVAITGQEKIGLSFIITEGFGDIKMSQRAFNLLKKFEGYMASVNGSTQIRAGVLRPEIIISHDKLFDEEQEDKFTKGIIPGMIIRIIRPPYFGAIGNVISLPKELQKIKTGSYVRVLEAELEDKRRVFIPRANVEIIET